jgi:uncharacterized membrane protein YgcG
MSAGQSRRSVASSTRSRQEAELAVAEKRERAAAETAAAAARASRLAAAAADAARAAVAKFLVLRGNVSSSISTDDSADTDLDALAREAAQERAVRWAAAHTHERDGSPDRRGRANGAPGGGMHGGGAPRGGAHSGGAPGGAHDNGSGSVDGERGLHRRRDFLSPDQNHGYHGFQAVVRDVGPGGG